MSKIDEKEARLRNLCEKHNIEMPDLEKIINDYQKPDLSAFEISKKYKLKSSAEVYTIINRYRYITCDETRKRVKVNENNENDELKKEGRLINLKKKHKLTDSDLKNMLIDYQNGDSAFNISRKYKLTGSSEAYSVIKSYAKIMNEKIRFKISKLSLQKKFNAYELYKKQNFTVPDISRILEESEEDVEKDIKFCDKVYYTTMNLKDNNVSNEKIVKMFKDRDIEMTEELLLKISSICKKKEEKVK